MNSDPVNHCSPPWFLIAKSALRGVSLETLSRQYQVSVSEIQSRLDVAITRDPQGAIRIRNNAEITQASQRARNDLVSILLESIEQLMASPDSRLEQTDKLTALTAVASKLFAWPSTSTLRTVNVVNPPPFTPGPDTNNAVNLSLTATTPEQLRAIANQERERQAQQNTTTE